MQKEKIAGAVLRLLNEADGGPIDSGVVSRLYGCTVKAACTAITRLGNQGRVYLFRAVAGKLIYAFASEAHCMAFGLAELEADALKRMRERNARAVAGKNRAIPMRPGVDAPVTIKEPSKQVWAAKEADYSRAKRIVCKSPTFDARYQVDPATRVVGGFATQGIGRYEA